MVPSLWHVSAVVFVGGTGRVGRRKPGPSERARNASRFFLSLSLSHTRLTHSLPTPCHHPSSIADVLFARITGFQPAEGEWLGAVGPGWGRKMERRHPTREIKKHSSQTDALSPPFPSLPPVPPADLAALHTLFDRNLPRALALAESGGVTEYVGSPSGRSVFQVRAGRGGGHHSARRGGGQQHHRAAHTTFPPHFCTCDAFYFEVASKTEAAACKHQLAARLAECLGTASRVPVPDEILARLLIAG